MLRSRCITDGVIALYPACLGGALTESMAQDIPTAEPTIEDAEIVEVEHKPSTDAMKLKLSNRLKELAEKCGCKSVLIDGFEDLNLSELDGCNKISITAGASAPEARVQEIASELQKYTGALINESGEDKENIFLSYYEIWYLFLSENKKSFTYLDFFISFLLLLF